MQNKKSLTPEARRIIMEKSTEAAFTGKYTESHDIGSWLCRQCGLALFRSDAKFDSRCGWPAFDEIVAGAVREQTDADGMRTEIICARCGAHLGHVFRGEGITKANTRHCVNSASLDFVEDVNVKEVCEAIFAAGCFWGVEYYFRKLPGVLNVEVGYTGGEKDHPSYNEVCRGNTGHYEAVRVLYDPAKTDYETVAKYFFEIHDPEQRDGQGPDHGHQYLSAVFVEDEGQRQIAEKLIGILEGNGMKIATRILPAAVFWPAEEYHQEYYAKNGKNPYCHMHVKRF